MVASATIDTCFCCASILAMCRWVTWPISCARTAATSDSDSAAISSPVCTPMKPPGSAKALIDGLAIAKNSNDWPPAAGVATSGAENRFR